MLLTRYHVCVLVQILGQVYSALQWPVVVLAGLDHFFLRCHSEGAACHPESQMVFPTYLRPPSCAPSLLSTSSCCLTSFLSWMTCLTDSPVLGLPHLSGPAGCHVAPPDAGLFHSACWEQHTVIKKKKSSSERADYKAKRESPSPSHTYISHYMGPVPVVSGRAPPATCGITCVPGSGHLLDLLPQRPSDSSCFMCSLSSHAASTGLGSSSPPTTSEVEV